MIEIYFTIDGVEKKEMATFDSIAEMKYFLKTYNEQVLENYPTATTIRLGQCYTSVH